MDRRTFFKRLATGSAVVIVAPIVLTKIAEEIKPIFRRITMNGVTQTEVVIYGTGNGGWYHEAEMEAIKNFKQDQEDLMLYGEYKYKVEPEGKEMKLIMHEEAGKWNTEVYTEALKFRK